MEAPAPAPTPTADRRVLVVFALAGALASVYMMRQADADLWGHLRYGRLFVEERGLPTTDPFAFTSEGLPWTSHEYLSQILLWLAYATAGQFGLVVLKCLIGGATIWFLYRAMRLCCDDPRIWVSVLLLTAQMVGRGFLFRPQLFTFLLLAVFVNGVLAHLLGRPSRLWLLPLLMALWVNLHGGFLAGLGVLGLALGLRALQALQQGPAMRLSAMARATCPLMLCLAGCFAATLANPIGWRLWPYLGTELTCDVNRRFIDEWQPLSLSVHGWTALMFWVLVGLLVLAAVAATTLTSRVAGLAPWQWLLSCVPLAFLACRSVRHVPVFAVWAGPVLALLGQAAWGTTASPGIWRRLWPVLAILAVIPTLMTIRLILEIPQAAIQMSGPVLGSCSPCGAAAFLKINGLRGRIYNPLWWGSYLSWELYPSIRVSMDGRNVTLFRPAQVEENLSFYLTEAAPLEAPLCCGADFLLVPADAPVRTPLRADGRWRLLYDDGQALLFVRDDAAHAEILRRHRDGRLAQPTGRALALGP